MSGARTAATARSSGSAGSAAVLIGRATLLENVRRREFYVLLILMSIFVAGALMANIVGVENAETGSFILNLGLSLAFLFAQVVTLMTAARQIPDESETRTLYPLLAKPVTRGQYIVGKWLASALTGIIAMGVLLLMGWVPAPKLEVYHAVTFLQCVTLQTVAIAAIAALSLFSSLLLPKLLNIALLVGLVFKGGAVAGFIQARAVGGALEGPVIWLTGYIPDFRLLELTHAYTGGVAPLPPGDFAMRVVYGAILTAVPVAAAIFTFNRRSV